MKNIVIVVDMQEGFTKHEQPNKLTERIINLLNRNIFDIVIATKFINERNSVYEKLFEWQELETEEEQTIPGEIIAHANYVIEKHIYNCVNTDFIQKLCQLNDGIYPEKIFVVGVDTDCCVLAIATALFENNIRPIILSNYVASNGGLHSHEAGLTCLCRLIGAKQITNIVPFSREDLENI
jgi:nicotinamidase-related amidase